MLSYSIQYKLPVSKQEVQFWLNRNEVLNRLIFQKSILESKFIKNWEYQFECNSDKNIHNQCILKEIINIKLLDNYFSKYILEKIIIKKIKHLLNYRKQIIIFDLVTHKDWNIANKQKIAITGASGFIGIALSNYLKMAGHKIIRISRKKSSGDVVWNPEKQDFALNVLQSCSTIIHLAGSSISSFWTKRQKIN